MKLLTTAILFAIVATAFVLPTAGAVPQPYVCSRDVNPSCGYDICFAPTYTERPACANVPVTTTVGKPGVCTEATSPCSFGKLACVTSGGSAVVCVPDPCATTRCASAVAPVQSTPIKPGVCTEGHAPCYNPWLVCVTNNGQTVACVYDPCATTKCTSTNGAPQQQPIPVYSCNFATNPCWNGAAFCFAASEQVPFCAPFGVTTTTTSASCTEVVAAGAAGAVCTVNGKQVGPVATCQYCDPIVVERCTESTSGAAVSCYSPLVQTSTAKPAACMERYWSEDVGPVGVVSPDSCTYELYVNGQPVGLS